MGIISSGDGSRLQQILVDTHQGAGISGRDIGYLFGVFTHHDDSALNVLYPKFRLLSSNIVRSHDANLLSSCDLSREHSTECVETTLVRCRNHFRDVHTHRSTIRRVAMADSRCGLIIHWTIVKTVNTVSLGFDRRRKVQNNHFQNSVTGREPLLHNTLQQLLASVLFFLSLEFNTNSLQHFLDLSVFFSHDSFEQSGNGRCDKLAESTLEGTSLVTCRPDGTTSIKVPITPELCDHFVFRHVELRSISLGEFLQGECPLMKTRTERDGSLRRVDLDVTKHLIVVSSNDNVHGLNGTAESLIKLFSRQLKL
mmetsp:Transcript_27826/g.59503  ORF Transcript_27826/g.59503 Transcript_27826/m.59503 type:complete len:311 (+) Transcript_27826:1271-2203(+)